MKGVAKRGAPYVLELSDAIECPELVSLVFEQSSKEKKKKRADAVTVRVKAEP
jgi:hypothetical protein